MFVTKLLKASNLGSLICMTYLSSFPVVNLLMSKVWNEFYGLKFSISVFENLSLLDVAFLLSAELLVVSEMGS